jgi:hypothetical protein
MPAPRKVTKTTALVTMVFYATMELDVEELVRAHGPQARTKKFLTDYAIGNSCARGICTESTVNIDQEQVYEYQR